MNAIRVRSQFFYFQMTLSPLVCHSLSSLLSDAHCSRDKFIQILQGNSTDVDRNSVTGTDVDRNYSTATGTDVDRNSASTGGDVLNPYIIAARFVLKDVKHLAGTGKTRSNSE